MKLTLEELARLNAMTPPPPPPPLPGVAPGPTPLAALLRYRRARFR